MLHPQLRGEDLNLRPSGYEPDELPGCSTAQAEDSPGRGRVKGFAVLTAVLSGHGIARENRPGSGRAAPGGRGIWGVTWNEPTMSRPIYLDAHATTPVDPRVLEAMLPYFSEKFGNAASRTHAFGWVAESAVDRARELVAAAIGAEPREIAFTSGATESDNLAIKGVAEAERERGDHVVTTAIEHHAVLDSCRHLERLGFQVTVVPVEANGIVDAAKVVAAMTERTVLVSVMLANNEVGTLQPVAEIAALCGKHGALFHCDAVQAHAECNIGLE